MGRALEARDRIVFKSEGRTTLVKDLDNVSGTERLVIAEEMLEIHDASFVRSGIIRGTDRARFWVTWAHGQRTPPEFKSHEEGGPQVIVLHLHSERQN